MAYRKRNFRGRRKTFKRRAAPKRRQSRRSASSAWRPLPKSKLFKFKYNQEISLNPSAGGVAENHVFSANGLYDPDITTTGHQPYGFDQMMAMYNHFTVVGSKIKVTVPSNQASYPCRYAIFLRSESTSLSGLDPERLLEQPGHSRVLTLMPTNFSPNVGSVTYTFSAKKFFGVSNVVGESQYRGSVTTNPTEGAYYLVMMLPQSTDDVSAQILHVEIEYTAVLTEPYELAQS